MRKITVEPSPDQRAAHLARMRAFRAETADQPPVDFPLQVAAERARLSLLDPTGEASAVAPLTPDAVLDEAMRRLASMGAWDVWQKVSAIRWT